MKLFFNIRKTSTVDELLKLFVDVPNIDIDQSENPEQFMEMYFSGNYDLGLMDFGRREGLYRMRTERSETPLWSYVYGNDSWTGFSLDDLKRVKSYGVLSTYTLPRDKGSFVTDLTEFQRNLRVPVT